MILIMTATETRKDLARGFLSIFHPNPSSENRIETSYCYIANNPNMSIHCPSVEGAFDSWEQHGKRENSRTGNFYFGATSKKGDVKGRSKKGDALRGYAIPLEIDADKSEEDSGSDLIESTKKNLLEHTKELPLEPSGLLDSGGGLLAAYQLSEPLDDLSRWEDITKRVAHWFNAEFGLFVKKGSLDKPEGELEDGDYYDADRSIAKRNTLLRFPKGKNHRYDWTPPVSVHYVNENSYSIEELEAAFPPIPEEHSKTRKTRYTEYGGPEMDAVEWVQDWLEAHEGIEVDGLSIEVDHEKYNYDDHIWVLKDCPMRDHTNHDLGAFIKVNPDGIIGAGCHHATCGWGWKDLRKKDDPAIRQSEEYFSKYETREGEDSMNEEKTDTKNASDKLSDDELLSLVKTPAEIVEEADKNLHHVLQGMNALGSVSLVYGPAKVAGKTTFTLAKCRAIIKGETFIGREVMKTNVVYMTEQGNNLNKALEDTNTKDLEGLYFMQYSTFGMKKLKDSLEDARRLCRLLDAGLLVVDTGPRWAKMKGEDENLSGAVREVLEPLVDIAQQDNLAVDLIWHSKRDGGFRGSSEIAHLVDSLLEIKRDPKNKNVRILDGEMSRLVDAPVNEHIEFSDGNYYNYGDEARVQFRKAVTGIFGKIHSDGSQIRNALIKETAEDQDIGETTVERAMNYLVDEGDLVKKGRGVKGDPYVIDASKAKKMEWEEADHMEEDFIRTFVDVEGGADNEWCD